MAAPAPVLRHLHRLLDPSAAEAGSDTELLSRFVRTREQSAFAALVARHGPMVHRLCRRVLGDVHAAEDAAQAAFVVLARKAAGIRHPETLAAWLHGVAYHLALKTRTAEARRRRAETRHVRNKSTSSDADPLAEVSGRELLTLLDAELQRLPEKYRLPVILCCLEGRSQPEAARLLGWTAGSVKGRLERGRALLHQRLVRRGLTLSAALLTLEAAHGTTTARLPSSLAESILHAAQGAIPSMASPTVKAVCLLAVTIGAAASGAGLLVRQLPPAEQPQAEQAKQPSSPAKRAPVEEPLRTDRYGDPLPEGAVARLGTIRWRHGGLTTALQFAPDGRSLLTQGYDGLRIWDVATGKCAHHLEHRDGRYLNPGILSADGKRVVTVDMNRKENLLQLWDVPTGRLLREFGDHPCLSACWSPDGKWLATLGTIQPGIPRFRAFADVVSLWDLSDGRRLRSWKAHEGGSYCGLFTADGKTLITGGADQTIRFWDVASGAESRCLRGEPAAVGHVALSPDEKLLLTIGLSEEKPAGVLLPSGLAWCAGKRIVIRDTATGKEVRRLSVPPPKQRGVSGITAAAFTPDGKKLVTGGVDRYARLWDVSTGEELRRYDLGHNAVWSLALSPDGRTLAALPGGTTVRLIDTASGAERFPRAGHGAGVRLTALSPDAQTILTAASGEAAIVLWDAATGREKYRLEGMTPLVADMRMTRDGRNLYSFIYEEGRIIVWDLAARKPIREFARPALLKAAQTINALSADGETLAMADPRSTTVYLLRAANGEVAGRLDGHQGGISRLAFPADGRSLVVMDADGAVHVWDLARRTKRLALPATKDGRASFRAAGRDAVALAPDGRLFAHVRGDGAIVLSDLATGESVHVGKARREGVYVFAFSPDGRMLAWMGRSEHTIHLLEVATGAERRRLLGHHGQIESLAFSADGRRLVSGSADTTALVWDLTGASDRLPSRDVKDCWANLADANAERAYESMRRLTSLPIQAVPYIRERIRPAASVEKERVRRPIADLDSEQFDIRQKAAEELRRLGERAEPGLREALQGKLSLEARKRVEELLEGVRAWAASPECLRNLRAVEVLEHIGTPDARDVLRALADGAPAARLTREAKSALERLTQRRAEKRKGGDS